MPVATAFVEAQEEMRQIQQRITQYVSKTLELGAVPSDEDLAGEAPAAAAAAVTTNFEQAPNAQKFLQSAARCGYATAPVKTARMPPGIPYIVGNEAAERLSFYGMNAILTVFMAAQFKGCQRAAAPMTEVGCGGRRSFVCVRRIFHAVFGRGCFPTCSSESSGPMRYLSIVYCSGHLALALNSTRAWAWSWGCRSLPWARAASNLASPSNVGDQFGAGNQHLMARMFGWFYFSINFGAFFSQLDSLAAGEIQAPCRLCRAGNPDAGRDGHFLAWTPGK